MKNWRLQPSSIDCYHRNVQQHSSNISQPAADDYVDVIPYQTRQDEEPQYENIQLGHRQHGPDAGRYGYLNPETQRERPQYDVISRRQRDTVAIYVNYDTSCAWQLISSPAADGYDTLSSETKKYIILLLGCWCVKIISTK